MLLAFESISAEIRVLHSCSNKLKFGCVRGFRLFWFGFFFLKRKSVVLEIFELKVSCVSLDCMHE